MPIALSLTTVFFLFILLLFIFNDFCVSLYGFLECRERRLQITFIIINIIIIIIIIILSLQILYSCNKNLYIQKTSKIIQKQSMTQQSEEAQEKGLTEAFPCPPVGLLHGGELNLPVQPQSVKQVGGATLRLTDDVEVRQAAQPVHFAVSVVQVSLEASPHVVTDCFEALRAQREQVPPIRVGAGLAQILGQPARVLDLGKEPLRNRGKQLWNGNEAIVPVIHTYKQ